jgi:hypothetical protein
METRYFVTRNLTLNGVEFRAGDEIPTEDLSRHRLRQLVALRVLRSETRVELPEKAKKAFTGEGEVSASLVHENAVKALPEPLLALLKPKRKKAK